MTFSIGFLVNIVGKSKGGTFVFPVDVEARLDDREKQILGRIERLRGLEREASAAESAADIAADTDPADTDPADTDADPSGAGPSSDPA